jgi:hypothetical protein
MFGESAVSKAVRCSCFSEAVFVEPDQEVGLVYISIMEHYGTGSRSVWDRIRWCWHMLREGRPYGDQMCLDRKRAKALVDLINEAVEKLPQECKDAHDPQS